MGPFIGLSSLSRRRCFSTVDALWCHTIEEFGSQGGNESVVRRVPGGNAVGSSAVLSPNFLQTMESRHRFSHAANVCWYLFTLAHSRGIRDEQSQLPALRDLSILKEQRQLHTCTGTQTLWRKESKIITWNCITWILQLSVDHSISLGNTSYRSCYSANLVCLMFFVVILVLFVHWVIFVLVSFCHFGKEKGKWYRPSLMAAIVPGLLEKRSHIKKLLLTLFTDEKLQTQNK